MFANGRGRESYSSVVGGDSRDDEHEVECDYELDNKGLQIRALWKSSGEVVMLPVEYQSEGSTR